MEYLRSLVDRNPPFFSDSVSTITRYIDKRHWFELGLALLDFLKLEALIGERSDVYKAVVQPFERLLDPFHLARLVFLVSEEISSPNAARKFLEDSLSKFDGAVNARNWIRLQMVQPYVSNGDFERALHLLLEIELTMDYKTDPAVRSLFYKVRCSLDKARGDNDAFYESGFLYLSASGQRDDLVLAFDLAHAALCSTNVFSFVELTSHGILECLRKTENEWLRAFVFMLADGSIEAISEYEQKYLAILRAKPGFVPYLQRIELKVRLSVLQELIFQQPYESRVFKFSDLEKVCQVTKNEVELLILKALAGGLLEGFIDQVEETFVVTRCRPKALTRDKLVHLKAEIERWTSVVHQRRIQLERQARPVFS
jgi:26S proteasome regulatory subunit N9